MIPKKTEPIIPLEAKVQTPTQTPSQEKHKFKDYTVKSGDTPWSIANKHDGMCNEQFSNANPQLNCINPKSNFSCDTIHPGDKVRVWDDKK